MGHAHRQTLGISFALKHVEDIGTGVGSVEPMNIHSRFQAQALQVIDDPVAPTNITLENAGPQRGEELSSAFGLGRGSQVGPDHLPIPLLLPLASVEEPLNLRDCREILSAGRPLRVGKMRNPTHPVGDSDNIRSSVPIIRPLRDIAAERGMSPHVVWVKHFDLCDTGAARGAAGALPDI